jgi:hypothetical protein
MTHEEYKKMHDKILKGTPSSVIGPLGNIHGSLGFIHHSPTNTDGE